MAPVCGCYPAVPKRIFGYPQYFEAWRDFPSGYANTACGRCHQTISNRSARIYGRVQRCPAVHRGQARWPLGGKPEIEHGLRRLVEPLNTSTWGQSGNHCYSGEGDWRRSPLSSLIGPVLVADIHFPESLVCACVLVLAIFSVAYASCRPRHRRWRPFIT